MERSIYDLVGGEEALAGVVDDFHARVLADPGLRHFDLVAAHLVDALLAAGVAPPVVGEIISIIVPLAPEVISQPLMA